jgi:hypothetical protein
VLVAATVGLVVGHWILMAGILLREGDADAGFEPVMIGVGLAVMAATVIAAAVAAGAAPATGVAAAVIGGLVIGIIWLLRSDEVPLPALVGGLSIAAALAVPRAPHHDLRIRLLMAGLMFGYAWWVTAFSAAFAIIVAPLLPFPTVGVSDFAATREARRRADRGYAATK